jgi:hypothetical protein
MYILCWQVLLSESRPLFPFININQMIIFKNSLCFSSLTYKMLSFVREVEMRRLAKNDFSHVKHNFNNSINNKNLFYPTYIKQKFYRKTATKIL